MGGTSQDNNSGQFSMGTRGGGGTQTKFNFDQAAIPSGRKFTGENQFDKDLNFVYLNLDENVGTLDSNKQFNFKMRNNLKLTSYDCLYLIISFLPDKEVMKLQRLDTKSYKKIVYIFHDRNSNVQTKKMQNKESGYLWHYKNKKICRISIKELVNFKINGWYNKLKIQQQITDDEIPQWDFIKPRYSNYVTDIMDSQTQSILVNDHKLIAIDGSDNNIQIHLRDNSVDTLSKTGFSRDVFGFTYRKGDKHLWVIDGRFTQDDSECKAVMRLDLINLKWEQFPSTINHHHFAGSLIPSDNSYLYVFSNTFLERLSLNGYYPKRIWKNIDTQQNFGFAIRTIPHQTLKDKFYIFGNKGVDLFSIEGKKQNKKVVIKEHLATFEDFFEFSNPIYHDDLVIAFGVDHIHFYNFETKMQTIKGHQGATYLDISDDEYNKSSITFQDPKDSTSGHSSHKFNFQHN